MRPKFREVREQFARMDRLVLRFRKTESGARFACIWKNARIVRDLGEAAPGTEEPPAPPTA